MQRNDTGVTTMVEPYHIPLRAMRPKGARNLLVPGRGASGDQMAMSSFRVMAPVSQMGFAAGRAAQMCVREECSLDDLDVPRLQRAIEDGGQRLDLSHYGEYLRNGLLDHEAVAPAGADAFPAALPTLGHLRNNRFLVAWAAQHEGGTAVWVADRYQCHWSTPRQVARIAGELTGLHLSREEERRVELTWSSGRETCTMVSLDAGASWSPPERTDDRRLADARATGDDTWTLPDDSKVRVEHERSADGEGVTGVRLLLSRDGGRTWPYARLLDPEGGRDFTALATPRGTAIVYVRPGGELMFWHGSIEQVIDQGALEKYSEALHLGIMP
jgi:hypothetical protein